MENKNKIKQENIQGIMDKSLEKITKGFVSHYFETKQGYKDYLDISKLHDIVFKGKKNLNNEELEKTQKELTLKF